MKLHFLTMRNFMAVGNQTVKIPFVENQTVAIVGDIGSGKSTIVDAISICLFNRTYTDKKRLIDIINRRNKGNCQLSLQFEKDGVVYLIERNFKPDSYALKRLVDGEFQNVELSNKDDLTEKILEILEIDRKIFDQTVLLSSRQFHPLMEMTPAEKREFIKRLMNLERYDKMKEIISEGLKVLKNELSVLSGKRSVQESNIEREKTRYENEKVEYDALLLKEQKNVSDKATELLSVVFDEDVLSSFDDESQKVQDQITELEKTISKLTEIQTNIEQQKNNQKRLAEIKNELSEIGDLSFDDIDQLKESAKEKTLTGQQMRERYIKLKENIASQTAREKEISDLESKIVYKNASKTVEAMESERETVQDTIGKLRTKLNEHESLTKSIAKEIDKNKKLIDIYEKLVCPLCGNELTPEESEEKIDDLITSNDNHAKRIEENDVEIEKIKKQIKEATEQVETFNEELPKVKEQVNFQLRLDLLQEKHKKILRVDDSEIEKLKTEMKMLGDEIGEISDSITLKENVRSLIKEKNVIEQNIGTETSDDVEEKINDLKIKLDEMKERQTSLKATYAIELENKNKKSVLENDLEHAKNNLKKLEEKVISDQAVVDANKELENTDKEIEEINYKIDIKEKLIIAVGDKGVKKYIISRYIPVLNQLVKKYLTIFASEFQVLFESEKGLSANIYDRGEEISYATLSNGQSQQVNFAILFAIIEFQKIKNSFNFPLIFLDEIFDGSMSPDALYEILKGIQQVIPYINLITHRHQVSEMADNVIRVKRNNGFSKYDIEISEPEEETVVSDEDVIDINNVADFFS